MSPELRQAQLDGRALRPRLSWFGPESSYPCSFVGPRPIAEWLSLARGLPRKRASPRSDRRHAQPGAEVRDQFGQRPAHDAGQLTGVMPDETPCDQICPSGPSRSTTSPDSKSPVHAVIPAGSSDFRRRSTAATAPGSRLIEPEALAACRSQNNRALVRRVAGANAVPDGRPVAVVGRIRHPQCRNGIGRGGQQDREFPHRSRSAPRSAWTPSRRCRRRCPGGDADTGQCRRIGHLADRDGRRPAVDRRCTARRCRTAGSAHPPRPGARPARRAGRCRRTGSPRWRPCRSR